MRLRGQCVDELTVPGEPDRCRTGMRSKPAVIVAATLTEATAGFGKADQRYEQDVGYDFFTDADSIGTHTTITIPIGLAIVGIDDAAATKGKSKAGSEK